MPAAEGFEATIAGCSEATTTKALSSWLCLGNKVALPVYNMLHSDQIV